MNRPEPEDLRRIERAHFREVLHRKLPVARAALEEVRKKKEQSDVVPNTMRYIQSRVDDRHRRH